MTFHNVKAKMQTIQLVINKTGFTIRFFPLCLVCTSGKHLTYTLIVSIGDHLLDRAQRSVLVASVGPVNINIIQKNKYGIAY